MRMKTLKNTVEGGMAENEAWRLQMSVTGGLIPRPAPDLHLSAELAFRLYLQLLLILKVHMPQRETHL